MGNYRIAKLLLIFVVIIFTSAITVNYILSREIVCNYNVTGEGKDWIGFYGSFLGGAISALVAYIVMYKTIENNNENILRTLRQAGLENINSMKSSELDYLRKDLSERIGLINIPDILRICMYPESFDVKEELERLNDLYEKYQIQSNSSLLYYGNINDAECKLFFEKYNYLLKEICRLINDVTQIIVPYQYAKDLSTLPNKLSPYSKELNRLININKEVLEKAKSYYYKKQYELEDYISMMKL